MIFSLPLAFLGLLALPALAAIYLLRSRSRPQTVSSLMLWIDATRAREGGRILKRMHVPLLLILELAVATLLVLAMTEPRLRTGGAGPLVVVLDDSFSMQAGGGESPRQQALRTVEGMLRDEPGVAARFILAGRRPGILGDRVQGAARAAEALERWQCLSETSSLEAGIMLASQIGGPQARILVLTDRPSPEQLPDGRVVWRAFGRARPNAAIVHAARSTHGGRDRCLVEVANFAKRSREITVMLRTEPAGTATGRRVSLGPARREPLFFDLPPGTQVVRVSLARDTLDFDNGVVLLPERARPVRVALNVNDELLREAIRQALDATGRARLVPRRPELLVTDSAPPASLPDDTWTVRFVVDKEARAYVGPFVVDRAHPLCSGLDLGGVIWAAATKPPLPGADVISVGNVSLVTETSRADGRRDVRIRLKPDLSNLTRSANWPVLLCNLLDYRAAHLPGIRRSNVRLGSNAEVVFGPNVESAEVQLPDGRKEEHLVHHRRVTVEATRCGVYEVRTENTTTRFAVNPLQPTESDLRTCAAGRWGNWAKPEQGGSVHHPLAWLALLGALGLFAAHLALAGRSPKERTL